MVELFLVDNSGQLWHIWETTWYTATPPLLCWSDHWFCAYGSDGIDNPWSQCTWGAYYKIGGKVPWNYPTQPISLQATNNIHGGVEVFITSTSGELYHIWQSEARNSTQTLHSSALCNPFPVPYSPIYLCCSCSYCCCSCSCFCCCFCFCFFFRCGTLGLIGNHWEHLPLVL